MGRLLKTIQQIFIGVPWVQTEDFCNQLASAIEDEIFPVGVVTFSTYDEIQHDFGKWEKIHEIHIQGGDMIYGWERKS